MNPDPRPNYGPIVTQLLSEPKTHHLGPGSPNQSARSLLQQATVQALFADQPVVDSDMAKCCISGLWLWHDFLDESHSISQNIDSPSGSYWHGIMHRREPDYLNGKYWFRQVGSHSIFPALHQAAQKLANSCDCPRQIDFLRSQTKWDPNRFIDACQELAQFPNPAAIEVCQNVAKLEWELLFEDCFQQAIHA